MNLRTQIRSLPLCPLSYGAGRSEVAAGDIVLGDAVYLWWNDTAPVTLTQ